MPARNSCEGTRDDTRSQQRLIQALTKIVNAGVNSKWSDLEFNGVTTPISCPDDNATHSASPISNRNDESRQESEYPHYRTETVSSKAKKGKTTLDHTRPTIVFCSMLIIGLVTRRHVNRQAETKERRKQHDLSTQAQERIQQAKIKEQEASVKRRNLQRLLAQAIHRFKPDDAEEQKILAEVDEIRISLQNEIFKDESALLEDPIRSLRRILAADDSYNMLTPELGIKIPSSQPQAVPIQLRGPIRMSRNMPTVDDWEMPAVENWDDLLLSEIEIKKPSSQAPVELASEMIPKFRPKVAFAPSQRLDVDDAVSHFSRQSRGSRATADRSHYSRSSRQHSLSPIRETIHNTR